MPKKLSRFVLLLLAVIMMLQIAGVASAEAIELISSPDAESLRRPKIRFEPSSGDYNGKIHEPKIRVTQGGRELIEGKHFVASSHSTSGSRARRYRIRFVIIGIGPYKGFATKTAYYTIRRAGQGLTVVGEQINASYDELQGGRKRYQIVTNRTGVDGEVPNTRLIWRKPRRIKAYQDGSILLPRRLKRGTYTISVYARAGGNYTKSERKTVRVVVA